MEITFHEISFWELPRLTLNMLKGVKLWIHVSWTHVNGPQFPKRRMRLCFISSVSLQVVGGYVNINSVAVCIVSGTYQPLCFVRPSGTGEASHLKILPKKKTIALQNVRFL